MMKKPYFKNILFIGDAAGRGLFIGPKIEGLNVGIDDAVRASIAISRSIENNNFDSDYIGSYYESLVNESPYTMEMTKIDEGYLSLFLKLVKNIKIDSVDPLFGFGLRLMKNDKLRKIAIQMANFLGYDKILPFIESEKTYVQVPIQLANRLGSIINSSYTPAIPTLSDRIARLQYNDDSESHITVENKRSEFMYNAEQIGHSELPQKHNLEYLQYALGKSLERLQTSYVDVYSLHNPKMQAVTNKELFNELDNLVVRGTIKSHDHN